MAYDRRVKAEQLEIIQDKVRKMVGDMRRSTALVDAAVLQARKSLAGLLAYMEKLGAEPK
jgi:hypothetical protein